MLYITTRSRNDAYTAHRALTENFAPDGGGYVPFQMPVLDAAELEALSDKSFSECVASILNVFFSVKLTGWDVEFAVGRNPLKLASLGSKITVAELHSNPEGKYSHFVKALNRRLAQINTNVSCPAVWAEIAVRIATLFGVWSDLMRQNDLKVQDIIDISLSNDDYYAYVAALYAKNIGLPIGVIVLSCNEGNPVWDMICRGTAKADVFSNVESAMMERILQNQLGCDEATQYLSCRVERRQYSLADEAVAKIKSLLFAASIGNARSAATINNVAKKDGYTLNRNTARAYGGLEDFRAQHGVSRYALLVAESDT